MPNIIYMRPGDSEEVAGAWNVAIEAKTAPSMISTSRHALPHLKETRRDSRVFGAYVLREEPDAQITLIGVGAELSFAIQISDALARDGGIKARVVSFPCQRLFEQQTLKYKRSVLRRDRGTPAVVIEPYAANGWERYAHAGICMKSFGHSLPGTTAYGCFGYEVGPMPEKVRNYLEGLESGEHIKEESVDL